MGLASRILRNLLKFCARWLFYTVTGIALLIFDPLGIDQVTSDYSESLADLLHFSPAHGEGAQKEVSVVLFDDDALSQLSATWPISLAAHSEILDAILFYRPRSVFVDIAFIDQRPDDGFPELARTIARYKEEGVRIYFAALPGKDGRLRIRSDLAENVDLVPLQALDNDRNTFRYPLFVASHTGHPAMAPTEGASAYRSPAYTLFQDMRPQMVPAFESNAESLSPIRVIWGTEAHPINAKWMGCNETPTFVLWRLFLAVRDGPSSLQQTCPHVGHIPAAYIRDASHDNDLVTMIEGNAVLVGASLAGNSDSVVTLTHGAVPGVYFHAAALENLLADGLAYRRSEVVLAGRQVDRGNLDAVFVAFLMIGLALYIPFEDRLGNTEGRFGFVTFRKSRLAFIGFLAVTFLAYLTVQIVLAGVFNLAVGNWLGILAVFSVLSFATDWRLGERLFQALAWVFAGFANRQEEEET
jgi:CHASE2 domain-containing sensor protein